MGFDTIVTNGRVVTATDTYSSDVAITAGKIAAIGQDLPRDNAASIIDAAGKYVLPGGIDVHTHLDMPFGGTTSADDFETGHSRRRFRRHHHSDRLRDPVQRPDPAHSVRHLDAEGFVQSSLRLFISLHHHRSGRRPTGRNERLGPRRRHQLQTVHGLSRASSCSTTPASSRRCARRQRTAAMVCMHAENGDAIDVIVQQALAEGKKAPKYHALTRPTTAEAEATGSGHRSR